MDRQTIVRVLNEAKSIIEALSSDGVSMGDSEGINLGEESTEGLQNWNDRPVEIQDTPRPPLTVRDKVMQSAKPQPGVLPTMGPDQIVSDEEDYMPLEYMAMR